MSGSCSRESNTTTGLLSVVLGVKVIGIWFNLEVYFVNMSSTKQDESVPGLPCAVWFGARDIGALSWWMLPATRQALSVRVTESRHL